MVLRTSLASDIKMKSMSSSNKLFYFKKINPMIICLLFLTSYCLQVESLPTFKSCGRDLTYRILSICTQNGGVCGLENYKVDHLHRTKRKVVRECCQNPCDDEWIKIYCCL